MKILARVLPPGKRLLTFGLLTFLVAGCATHRIDWTGRVGNYTFDQAVIEFGPPDKQARLGDGTLVAEWLTRRGYVQSHPVFANPGACYGPIYPAYIETYSPDYFLRLTFDPAGRLQAWKKFAR